MNKALFVIDVQNYFINPLTQHLPQKIVAYIKSNRRQFSLIVFTHFVNTTKSNSYRFLDWKDCMTPPETDLAPEFMPILSDGIVVPKDVLSALKVSKVKNMLQRKKIDELYLCGIDTDCCVLATAYDAFDLGYKVYLLKDLCMTATGKNLHVAAVSMFRRNVGQIL